MKSKIFLREHFFHTPRRYNVNAATSLIRQRHCTLRFFQDSPRIVPCSVKEEQRQIGKGGVGGKGRTKGGKGRLLNGTPERISKALWVRHVAYYTR